MLGPAGGSDAYINIHISSLSGLQLQCACWDLLVAAGAFWGPSGSSDTYIYVYIRSFGNVQQIVWHAAEEGLMGPPGGSYAYIVTYIYIHVPSASLSGSSWYGLQVERACWDLLEAAGAC